MPFNRLWAGDYEAVLKPLLRERCVSCHGALQQKAGLRLDTVAGMLRGGKHGPVLVVGKAEQSVMVLRTSSADADERMPPEHEGQPFSEAQVALLKQWITDGASAPAGETPEADPRDHWAFRPRQRPPVPTVARGDWVRNPIDAFISRSHEAATLSPRPEAPRRLQIRRLYLDLIGLPPTEDEMRQALGDPSEEGYARTVDRLLEDPRHGERWARHWMDVWRYSDPWGLRSRWQLGRFKSLRQESIDGVPHPVGLLHRGYRRPLAGAEGPVGARVGLREFARGSACALGDPTS